MSIERDASYYDEIYLESEEYRKPYEESKYYQLWERLIELIPTETKSVLDLGCGVGQFAEFFNYYRVATEYIGVDISQEAIKIAKERSSSFAELTQGFPQFNFMVGSAYEIDITVDDFIVCLETLEHINDFKFIERIPMGVEIVFTVPDFNDPAHVRYFKNITEIVHRYERHIDFSHIEKFESWFVCKGVRI